MRRPKLSEYGFSVVEIVISLVLVIIGVMVGDYVVKHISSSGEPTNWFVYDSKADNFTAVFPEQPTVISIPTMSGPEGTYTSQGFRNVNDSNAYLVTRSIYTKTITLPTLSDFIKGNNSSTEKPTIINFKYIKVNGYQAETFEYSAVINGAKDYAVGELVNDKNTLYAAVTSSVNAPAPYSKYFINNFKVGK